MIKHLLRGSQAIFAHRYNLQPADRLIEPIFQTGLSQHHAIYLGVDSQGTEWVVENYKFVGVRLISAETFFRNKRQITVNRFDGSHIDRFNAVKRALSLLGKPYDLINYNCEHYASYVQNGKAESKQVNVATLILAALFISAAITE